MRYFVPKLQPTTEFNPQTIFQEKLGGLPFGLPTKMYPICKECGNPMALLAQFTHHIERLDLGKDGRVLFVFQCNNQSWLTSCQTWEQDSGANSCFVLEQEKLTSKFEKIPDGTVKIESEFLITVWNEFDDGISVENSFAFLDEEKYYKHFEDDYFEEIIENLTEATRLGSVPYWIQSPEIPEGYRFVGQLDDLTGFNFGDAGIGYIFVGNVKNNEELPKAKFLWQCS